MTPREKCRVCARNGRGGCPVHETCVGPEMSMFLPYQTDNVAAARWAKLRVTFERLPHLFEVALRAMNAIELDFQRQAVDGDPERAGAAGITVRSHPAPTGSGDEDCSSYRRRTCGLCEHYPEDATNEPHDCQIHPEQSMYPACGGCREWSERSRP